MTETVDSVCSVVELPVGACGVAILTTGDACGGLLGGSCQASYGRRLCGARQPPPSFDWRNLPQAFALGTVVWLKDRRIPPQPLTLNAVVQKVIATGSVARESKLAVHAAR